jgi:hypothetical protein
MKWVTLYILSDADGTTIASPAMAARYRFIIIIQCSSFSN